MKAVTNWTPIGALTTRIAARLVSRREAETQQPDAAVNGAQSGVQEEKSVTPRYPLKNSGVDGVTGSCPAVGVLGKASRELRKGAPAPGKPHSAGALTAHELARGGRSPADSLELEIVAIPATREGRQSIPAPHGVSPVTIGTPNVVSTD